MNVYVTSFMTESAAPMLGSMINSGFGINNLTSKLYSIIDLYVLADAAQAVANHIVLAFQKRLPDIILGMEGNRSIEEVEMTIFHELGHAIHYKQAGNVYWSDEIDYTIANWGYW